MRRKLSEPLIQQILVKFILSLPPSQHQFNRIIIHMHNAYNYYLDIHNLQSIFSNDQNRHEQLVFYKKINEYMPDCIRLQQDFIEELRDQSERIPSCGVIVVRNQKKEVLMVQDRRTKKYGFPKGKLAGGETLAQCAIRQMKEETNQNVKINGNHKIINVAHQKKDYYFFMGELNSDNPEQQKGVICEGKEYHQQITNWGWRSISEIVKDPKRVNICSFMALKQFGLFKVQKMAEPAIKKVKYIQKI